MAGGGSRQSNPTKARKRVEAESSASAASLVRARDGSAFARCEECNKDVPAALISFHNCSLDAKIKMNLETQVVENATEVKKTKKKASEKNSEESGEPKPKRSKKEKEAAKDPNKPKRPPTAFFIFMADFRKTYKEANPDCKEAKKVAKNAGEKWSSMTEDEKKPYIEKAAQLKADFAKGSSSSDAENRESNSGDDGDADESNKEEADESNEDADESNKDEADETNKVDAELSNKEDAEDSKKEDPEAESAGPE